MNTIPIESTLLTHTAFEILTKDLEGHGNVLSDPHRAALFELLDTFTGYCTGTQRGRVAFPLPTGMGKTSAVVAFLTALHRFGCVVPVSVAASKVEALCSIKRALLAHGVPEVLIGLKHAVPDASEPSTGNAECLFQLVTHARVRSGRDFDLFGTFEGQPRPLCIYDETLLRADVFAFNALTLQMALGALAPLAEHQQDAGLSELQAYLTDCANTIRATLDQLKASGDTYGNGLPVELPFRDEATLQAWGALLGKHRGQLKSCADSLGQLLAVSQESLQVLAGEQGCGVVAVRQAVPAGLRDVVVLDASTPVRELARMDPSIRAMDSFNAADLKSFGAVEVFQLLAAGGRSAVELTYGEAKREMSAMSREVVDIVRREQAQDPQRAFLFFCFVKRGNLDMAAQLRIDLARAGVDVKAVTAHGKPRFEFLTWGQHEGLNGYEHCQTVILAGVLHRAHLDIAAAIKGQQDHLKAPTPNDLVRQVVESEIAHCVYQAASRGSCRRVTAGRAVAMRLHLVHRGLGLKDTMDKVMPGAVWTYPEPQHLKKAATEGRTAATFGRLLDHLLAMPDDVTKVSSRVLKDGLGLDSSKAAAHGFTKAVGMLSPDVHGWVMSGRSVVRRTATYGFTDHSGT